MNCNDCQNLLPEYALVALAPREMQQVEKHLESGCAACREQLEEIRLAWSTMAGTLEPVSPPPEVKQDLIARIREEVKVEATQEATPTRVQEERREERADRAPEHAERHPARWLAALPYVAASLFGIGLGFWLFSQGNLDEDLAALHRERVAEAEQTFGVKFAKLDVTGDEGHHSGYLVWDGLAEQLHVVAYGLAVPAGNAVYRVWLVTDDHRSFYVGDLAPPRDGVVSAVLNLPEMPDAKAIRAVITLEPRHGGQPTAEPQGPTKLSGTIIES